MFWTLRDRRSHWVQLDGDENILVSQTAEKLALTDSDVYISVSTSKERAGNFNRISNESSIGIMGLWADIDIADPDVHKKWNLPPTEEAAFELLDACGVAPTLVIHSGHGLQAWWLFQEFWEFGTADDRLEAAKLSQDWNTTLRVRAAERGWTIDSTFDLARVMRVPGTTNFKGVEPVAVRLTHNTGIRFVPDDFTEFCVDDRHLSELMLSPSRSYVVGPLILKEDAVPPFSKFESIRVNDPNFSITWDRRRRDLHDQSPSSYDLSLASQVARVGWSDQEIADLLIAGRKRHGDDLKLRQDYYKRTISKARESVSRVDAAEQMEEVSHALEEARRTGDDEQVREVSREVLGLISEQLGLEIVRIVKYNSTPPSYRLIAPTVAIDLGGPGDVLSWNRFRESVAGVANLLIPRFKAPAWDRLIQNFLDAAEEEDVGIESTESGQVYSWLSEYLLARHPTEDVEQAIENEYPYVDAEKHVCIFAGSLRKWLWLNRGEKISQRDLGRMLRSFGCDPMKLNVTVEGRRTTRSAWRMPASLEVWR